MDTGHNSVVKAPNNVDDWIVYHSRDAGILKNDDWYKVRVMRIDPLLWGRGRMFTPAPTKCLQDAPGLPLIHELFDGDLSSYEQEGGSWEVSGSRVVQTRKNCISSLMLKNISLSYYHMEVTTKWQKFHMGGRYGIYGSYSDVQNNVQIILDAGRRSAEMFYLQNGIKTGAVPK